MKRQRGIALLGVLWTGIILALLAGGVSDISRGDIDLARNQLESTRAELAAHAAAEIAVLGLVNGGDDAILDNGGIYAWAFDGAEVRVQVMPEAARIDLNQADEATLTSLFVAAGAEQNDAKALAQAVMDFRDGDDIRMELGAEDEDYEVEGYFIGAKDAPFVNVQELAGVMGMTLPIYRRALGGLTVYSGRGGDKAEPMPAIVAAALNEDAFEPAPPTRPFSIELTNTPNLITEPVAATDRRAALSHIHAEAVTQSGAIFALDLVVQTGRSPRGVYNLIDRRRGEVELFDMSDTKDGE